VEIATPPIVTKPFTPARLIEAIPGALESKGQRKASA
jgi:hypothetical protein